MSVLQDIVLNMTINQVLKEVYKEAAILFKTHFCEFNFELHCYQDLYTIIMKKFNSNGYLIPPHRKGQWKNLVRASHS